VSAVGNAAGVRLSCERLDVHVANRVLVEKLDAGFEPGSITAVLGRNGAGKTLTLHTLAGLRAPSSGTVRLGDRAPSQWPRLARARVMGLLPQQTEDAFPSTVIDAALVGRHPHIGFWSWESEADRALARSALAAVELEDFEQRDVITLSGGERRRVALAALLTQDPNVYLLDEPINHLDPHHQVAILELLRAKAAEGRTIVMTIHDAALAARYATHALLLFGDGTWLHGQASDVLAEGTMSRLYGLPVRELQWTGGRTFVMGG